MRKLIILLKKDFIDGLRNWEIMTVVLVPIILSLLMGLAFSISKDSLPKVAIISPDEEGKALFPEILFKEVKWIDTEESGRKLLEKNKVHAVLIIPEGMDKRVKKGEKPQFKVILDDKEGLKSSIVRAVVKKILETHFEIALPVDLVFEKFHGLSPKQRLLSMWILLGIFMVGLTVLPMSVSSEKEKKTLDALLLTPISERDFLLSKLIWGSLLMLLNVIILLIFNDGTSGNWGGLVIILLVSMFASISIGLFIAIIAPTQSTTSIISTFVLLLMIMSVSIAEISDTAKNFVSFLPGYHVSEGVQKTAVFNKGVLDVYQHILVLLGWGTLFMGINLYKLKKRGD